MDQYDVLLFFALLLIGLLLLLLLLIFVFGLRYELVKQEERLVIYRLGRFARIAGPGYVFYASRLETIERRLNVREENKKISVDGIFVNGVPFGYTLDIWLRNDPQAASQQSQQPLAHLAEFDDNERLAQTKVVIKRALLESLGKIQQEYPVLPNAPHFKKLLPIFPGQPAFNDLMDLLRDKLEQFLPDIGVLPAAGRPITVTNINLDKQTVDGFNQGRSLTLLHEALPDLRSDQLLEMVAKINGIDLNQQRFQLSREGNAQSDIDISMDEESNSRTRVRDYAQPRPVINPVREQRPAEQSSETSQREPVPQIVTQAATSEQAATVVIPEKVVVPTRNTNASDWQVLKKLAR